jgi:hypothetical protein
VTTLKSVTAIFQWERDGAVFTRVGSSSIMVNEQDPDGVLGNNNRQIGLSGECNKQGFFSLQIKMMIQHWKDTYH